MKVGYARTSTVDQAAGLDAQIRDLTAAGCEKIFREQVSSMADQRQQLEAVIDFIREGDEVVVTKIDRLARSVADLLRIVERVRAKGAALHIGNLGHINGTPTSQLLLTMLGAIAEFERNMMLERQREGIAKAKAEGKYKGRAPTAQRQAAEVLRLANAGETRPAIAKRLGMSERSVYRILAAA
jgi:DNA invertase Pin-like site-specific DNA recombinase